MCVARGGLLCSEGLLQHYKLVHLTGDQHRGARRPNGIEESEHKDKKQGNYVRMLFVDYSSAFNTIVPGRLFTQLRELGLISGVGLQ